MRQTLIHILEFDELKRIADYLELSSKKDDTTLPKIKSIIQHMQDSKHHHPVCKITVEEEQ